MSSFQQAQDGLNELTKWASLRPSDPVGLGIKRRHGEWVIVVSVTPEAREARIWPDKFSNVPVIVEMAERVRLKTHGR